MGWWIFMPKPKGIDIKLYTQTVVGTDPFGAEIKEEKAITIHNVLVYPTDTDTVTSQLNLTGKKAEYTLSIPKGDKNNWTDKTVEFWGKKWKTFGLVSETIEELTPLSWNKKVMVERYEH